MAKAWNLMLSDTRLGRLSLREGEGSWLMCAFEPTDAFERAKPLFDEDLRIRNASDTAAWEKFYETIRALGLRLEPEDGGEPIREFLIHIENDEAWVTIG